MTKTCIIIAGPTAVGKTSLSIRLAQHFSTEIISADSRQCYKELNIGVAKPSVEELQKVPHYFISTHSVYDDVNAVVFEQYALQKINEIFRKQDIAILTGGTGLYIKAFCEGMDEIPPVSPDIRKRIVEQYRLSGIEWLQNEVKKEDELYYSQGEILNPQRLMRALEVKLSAGRSIIEFQQQQKKKRDFDMIRIGLELPREQLYQNINERVDSMMSMGLEEEVRSLMPLNYLNALQTVGYSELFDFFEGSMSYETAVNSIKQNTRHYAKRQMTWFKKDEEIKWCLPEFNTVLKQIQFKK